MDHFSRPQTAYSVDVDTRASQTQFSGNIQWVDITQTNSSCPHPERPNTTRLGNNRTWFENDQRTEPFDHNRSYYRNEVDQLIFRTQLHWLVLRHELIVNHWFGPNRCVEITWGGRSCMGFGTLYSFAMYILKSAAVSFNATSLWYHEYIMMIPDKEFFEDPLWATEGQWITKTKKIQLSGHCGL